MSLPTLSHLTAEGTANMVDVSSKPPLLRRAKASGKIILNPETIKIITDKSLPKGDVWAVARIAAIMAAKKTAELIPLCHSLPISHVGIEFKTEESHVEVFCEAICVGSTGVEMEALTGVSVALLSIYDMCKAVDKNMQIIDIKLLEKTKRTL